MCFAPWVSLTTAIVEILVASFILIKYKNYLIPVFSAIFVYVLGFYQFSEFMICTSSYPILWATIGFSTYTFLPAIALNMVFRLTKTKFPNWTLYILPVFFVMIAFLKTNFIAIATCFSIFVSIRNSLFMVNLPFTLLYSLYYFGFILAVFFLSLNHLNKNHLSKIYWWFLVSDIIILFIPMFLVLFIPALGMVFPSVYCEFALGFSIVAIIVSDIYSKYRGREKF